MLNKNQSRELKIITRDRKREFNDVRQSHSRRKDLSQSQLSKSVGKSRVNREFQNLRETSRFNNQQNEQSRCMRQIKQSQNNLTSRSHRDLMCPCCYNKKQAQLKHQRRQQEQRLEEQQIKETKQSIFQEHIEKQLQYEHHLKHNIQEMNQFNKSLMQKHQNKKMQEINQKRHQGQLIKMDKQNFDLEKEKRIKHSLEIRNLLKQKYEEQMRIKEEKQNILKKINQTFDQQHFVVDAILPNKPQIDSATSENIRNAYKEELLKQIHQRQVKKKLQIQDLKGLSPQKPVPQFQLITFAQKRNEEAKKIAKELKQKQLHDMNEKKNQQQFSRQQKEMDRIERERQRKKIIAETQVQKMHQEEARRQKIDNYLSDLKTQIEQNKRKRLQELQWINEKKYAEPIIKQREEREFDKDSCKGCHKKYPKKMLSEFITIMK